MLFIKFFLKRKNNLVESLIEMRNDPIFKTVDTATKEMSLAELKALNRKDVSNVGLSSKDIVRLDLYFPSIRKVLVNEVERANIEEAINEMTNKFLLSDISITRSEARKAAERIFIERGLISKETKEE